VIAAPPAIFDEFADLLGQQPAADSD
jgi:hypothetical protein